MSDNSQARGSWPAVEGAHPIFRFNIGSRLDEPHLLFGGEPFELDPHDPLDVIGPALAEVGAEIVVAGFPFGEYDLLVLYEAADDVTAASVAMAVAAAGEVKSAKTTRLLSGQEWVESLRKRRIVTTRKTRQPHDHQRQPPELLHGGQAGMR